MTDDAEILVAIVDADRESLDRTVSALEAAGGFDTRATTDPSDVVSLVSRTGVDCVVSGYRFDDTDGLALLRRVRSLAPDIAFVLYTGSGSEAVASEAIRAGISDYVVKPVDGPELAARVTAAVDAAADAVAAREQLREHRRFVDDALDSLDDVFYVIDTDGRMVQWNRRFNDLFGYTDGEIAAMHPWEFVVEEDQPKVKAAIDRVLEEGEANVEVTAALADGSRVKLDLHGRRLTDVDGTVVGLCGIGRDVTERERTEWQLRTQNERLEEFASVLSHDLRNPLAVADGYLELARDDGDISYLEHVTVAHERMARLIDDVLTTARQGQVVDDPESVSLATGAERAWNSVETDGATLRVETDRTLQADPGRLQRILENLFRNCVEHGSTSKRSAERSDDSVEHSSTSSRDADGRLDDSVEHGGSDVTITVGDTPDGFYVADDGPGIPVDLRDRVFEAGVTSGDGTGFGLSIVRSLAAAHGWAVEATEADEGGARFEFVESPAADDD